MRQVETHESLRSASRAGRPSLNPYVLDEIAPTLAEIRAARSDHRHDASFATCELPRPNGVRPRNQHKGAS